MNACQKHNPGFTSIIFAIDRELQVPFVAPE